MFWDTSAVVMLLVEQPGSEGLRNVDERWRAVWWGTRPECVSALSRLVREGRLGVDVFDQILRDLGKWLAQASEVQPVEQVRARAERLLRVHPLRAADALQLAAALVYCEEQPQGIEFACLDERLRTAARAEGFLVVPSR